ncbi:hypothetical protein [Tunicatimonas pelagia]|nr:hypothetical protein [Tunicatimonas pelagia]WKN44051.1 hypothetical protein P0M28_03595 [Tunicatimonas pelagia]
MSKNKWSRLTKFGSGVVTGINVSETSEASGEAPNDHMQPFRTK